MELKSWPELPLAIFQITEQVLFFSRSVVAFGVHAYVTRTERKKERKKRRRRERKIKEREKENITIEKGWGKSEKSKRKWK